MQLNPMHVKISALFTGRLFRIPEYQRAYAWGTRQRSDLFNDILDVRRSGREHFMATVVALARTQDIRLIGADEYRTVEIVDGQQRITTLVVLLKAIEKALNQSDAKEEKLRREIAELLVKDDDHSLVLLQTNHDSSSVFTDYIRLGEINAAQAFTAADFNVVDAADECEAFVKRWSEDKPLIELVAAIRNQLSVIYHEISDEATVYRVFEVLNSRGLDVKWIDKLKSQLMALLFEHVEGGTRTEAVREMQVIWQDIYRTLGVRGDLGDEALRFAGTWTLTSRPNRIIGQEDAAAELAKAAGTKLQTIMVMASRLKAVVQAVDILDNNVRLRAVTKIAHARFVATAILLRKFDPDVRDRLLGRWERVTFRIFGLGGADTRHKVGDYVRLGYQIFTGNIGPEVIEDGLVALGKDWDLGTVISGPDYWSNCYEGWGEELRYLLFRYDEYLATSNGSSLNTSQWNKIWTDEPARSIEHIQPQSTEVSYMHHLGNLTMLPPRVNSSLQDKPPADKAATYRTSGLLATMAVGETINGGTTWDEAAVRSRASQIEDFVRREWGD
jgi:hypothetical protein